MRSAVASANMADRQLSVELHQNAPVPLDVAFACDADQVTAIFGPSGAGKTTVLRCIAGLHRPRGGRISCGSDVWLDTSVGRHLAPHLRPVGFVAQDYALFPHMTALGNVMASLGHVPWPDRTHEAGRLLELVHLKQALDRRPAKLSGGEQQRLALARAIARTPQVLLLDEPFAAIDRTIRRHLQDELDEIRHRLRIPVILVTHDFDDVIRFATDVVLIDKGRTVARGSIEDLTSRPDFGWLDKTAGFGSVFGAVVSRVEASRGLADLTFDGGVLVVPVEGLVPGAKVRVRVPAREVILATDRPSGISLHNVLEGSVTAIHGTSDGQHAVVQLAIGCTRLLAEVTRDAIGRLDLAVGKTSLALIKSVAVGVTKT
jgi:molybdate transport system ATP-binding protein